ncbi:MAG TPA: hypothetical protein VLA71_17315 [Algoriphagus sp.]|nr:hypothetical protein [Algoriphagus sp.]
MKLLVEVPEEKASFFLELLQQLDYVKAKKLRRKDEEFYEGLREAVDEVSLAKQGKLKLKSARELLDEL